MLATLSIMRYRAYNAGMQDLGNMTQSIWSATQGKPLEFTFRNGPYSRLAHHVEVIYFLLAPLYALFPSPITLLIFQSLLFASAGYPLFLIARRHFRHRWAPRLIVLVYLLYPVAQTAVLFDFHGDTLAMPLLIYALDALDRKAWKTYAGMLSLALMCKFYVSVSVVALGLVLFIKGRRTAGFFTSLVGLIWGGFAFFVVRPAFRPVGYLPPESTSLGYLRFYFGEIWTLLSTPALLSERLVTAFIVLVPSLWLGRHAWVWYLPALSVMMPALLAAGQVAAFDYRLHHYALAVPWMMMAVVEGGASLVRRRLSPEVSRTRPFIHEVAMQAAIVVVVAALTVDMPLNPVFWTSPPGWGMAPSAYGRTSRDRIKDTWLQDVVEPKDNLMASFFLASHLPNRQTLYLPSDEEYGSSPALIEARMDQVDVVVLDALFDYSMPDEAWYESLQGLVLVQKPLHGTGHPKVVSGGVFYDRPAVWVALNRSDFSLTQSRDGLLAFRRDGLPESRILHCEVTTQTYRTRPPILADFGSRIGLVDYNVLRTDDRVLALDFSWLALSPLSEQPAYFAVSRMIDISNNRMVHLPTYALHPTTDWNPGEIVRERFEIRMPEGVVSGGGRLVVGWYDSGHWAAASTDERSRLGSEFGLGVVP
jgi:uncharacterized membrane protein